jgi:high affinity sulfate transporter 1
MSTTSPTKPAEPPADKQHRPLPVLQGVLPVTKSRVPTDVMAGITLAALGIPEVMGYANIAQMPVVTGLYTILIPIAIFAVLGSSRHLVVGADSATAAILAAGLTTVAAAGSPQYVALASAVAIATGVVLVVARLIKLGFLADFLSRSVLIGFLTGVGIQVAVGQVGGLLGVPSKEASWCTNWAGSGTLCKLAGTLGNVRDTSMSTLAVSLAVLAVIIGCRAIDRRIPGALIAVIGAIVVSWAADLASHGVGTLGHVPGGLPSFGRPDVGWSDLASVMGTIGAIFIVILAQSAATSRAYAARYQERFSEDVDLIGLGAANIAAGLSGTFVVNGSPTKTQMVDSGGGRSQLSQLSTALVVLIVLLFLTGPLQYMPNAVLAAVVFLIGIELVDIAGMKGIWKVRPDEFFIATITAVFVVLVGVEQAVVLAIILSLLDYVRRGYHPARSVAQESPNGHLHRQPVTSGAAAVPGLVVYRFGADLFYANANGFSEDVLALTAEPGVQAICIDATAITDIDYSGWKTLVELHKTLSERDIEVLFADLDPGVETELRTYGLLHLLGPGALHPSVTQAVEAFRSRSTPAG